MKRLLLLIVCVISFAGCIYSDDEPSATSKRKTPAAKKEAAKSDEPATASTDTTSATTDTTPMPVETIQKKAAVGATGKGNYGEGAGFVTTPISTYFHVKERAVYDIQIPHAMNLYRATNDMFPKSHDEFMEVIIKANNIQLPKLPEGHKYVYDPETHTLMVEQPK